MQRTSITLAPEIMAKGKRNARKRGFATSFSAYVAWLIERDHEGAVVREGVSHYRAPAASAPEQPPETPPKSSGSATTSRKRTRGAA